MLTDRETDCLTPLWGIWMLWIGRATAIRYEIGFSACTSVQQLGGGGLVACFPLPPLLRNHWLVHWPDYKYVSNKSKGMFLDGQAEYLWSCEHMGSCLAIERSMKSRTLFECGPSPCRTSTSYVYLMHWLHKSFQAFPVFHHSSGYTECKWENTKKKRQGRLSQSAAVCIRYHRISGQKSVQGTPTIRCAEQRDV